MQIFKSDERPTRSGPEKWFTGQVWFDEIIRGAAPSRVQVVRVTFSPGARTAWHTHPVGQTLHVLSGTGRVQLRGEPIRTIHPGDTVQIAPGEMHWHGAAPDSLMSHLAIQEADASGENVQWLDHVTDAEYNA
jgi:quercetin dioxygenase-like cupin family protein